MRGVRFTTQQFDQLLQALAPRCRVFAPVRLSGRGRFSDTDSIRYGEVRSAEQIEFDEKSHFSPKEIVFPITQTLFYFTEEGYREPEGDDRERLIFLRACDIHAMSRLDAIFLGNGGERDPYYERLRRKVKFVLLECRRSFRNCFCVSMGTNRTEEFAMAVRRDEGGILAQVRDADLLAVLPSSVEPADYTPSFVTEDASPVQVPDPERLEQAIRERDFFRHPLWEDYARRCIACGRCNTHCSTCSCFTTTDIHYEENPKAGERRRVWASCHVDGFTDMAGGHQFRKDYGARMRFKVLHKIYNHQRRFGENMCVGCGRCDDQCPEYISFSACVNKISQALPEEE